ncbi:MAG: hypothetical protein DMF65_11880 [Acidobacteria bacterium]|nr:MAG: hypothetical protein DMF65_11880 [Acidobacteriota bacterium]
MNRRALFTSAVLISALLFFSTNTRAQEHDAPKVEVGVQFSSLSVTPPNSFSTENAAGIGARVTYNFDDHFAVEAEGDFFPVSVRSDFATGGKVEQAQFGVKWGKRWQKFGIFAKARPGFVSFDNTIKITRELFAPFPGATPRLFNIFTPERKTHLSADVGGVLEFYPSRRMLVRFDFGDTIIRYREHDELNESLGFLTREELPVVKAPADTQHNFQFSAGIGFRFRGEANDNDASPSGGKSEHVRRFEVGAQFSSLALRLHTRDFGFPFFGPFDAGTQTEAGFGGRVGFNINDHVALEVEGDFYPRERTPDSTTGGWPAQMQFGAKVGKRWQKFGVFAKARPGFVTFSRVSTFVSTDTITLLGNQQFTIPVFADRRRTYFSTDVGGVAEFYPSRRVLTRFDFGDTIIRFGQRNAQTFLVTDPGFQIPAETRHNFQFSAGIGLRF